MDSFRRAFSLLLVLGWVAVAPAAYAEELAALNKPAPMFRLPVYNPQPVGAPIIGLEKYVGPERADPNARAVLLSFMASFCEPCKREMPYLQKLHERYREKGLRVVVVAIDSEPEGQAKIDALIKKSRITYPVLKDRFNVVARRWLGTQTPLPSAFMIRPDGSVSSVHRGYSDEGGRILSAEVEKALGVAQGREPVR